VLDQTIPWYCTWNAAVDNVGSKLCSGSQYNEGAAGEASAAYDHTYGIMIVDIDIFHVGLHVGCAGHGNDGELLAAPLAVARVRVAVASRLITAKYY
jgi:hypothetical protein